MHKGLLMSMVDVLKRKDEIFKDITVYFESNEFKRKVNRLNRIERKKLKIFRKWKLKHSIKSLKSLIATAEDKQFCFELVERDDNYLSSQFTYKDLENLIEVAGLESKAVEDENTVTYTWRGFHFEEIHGQGTFFIIKRI